MSNLKWMYNPEWEYYTLVSASELREADKEYGIDKLKRELIAANERIKRLEEAGDDLATHALAGGVPQLFMEFVENWHKAKEAKP